MTPSPCRSLDAYLDGRLSESEEAAFEAHLADCETCVEAPADGDRLSAALRSLSDVVCPPAVLDRALDEARGRASDRSAVVLATRRRPRWQRALAPLLALGLIAVLWAVRPTPDVPSAPLATDVRQPGEDAPELAMSEPEAPEPDAPTPPGLSRPPTASIALASPPQADEVPAVPPDAPDEAPEAPEPEFAAEDVDQARENLALAFALVADAQRQASRALRDEAAPIAHTLDQTLPF